MYNPKEIEEKWQDRWEKAKIFEAHINKKPKFFVTFPIPYMNLSPHIGHFYTIMRVEAFARYKRMRGFNVLYPQGWHCTGSPIVAAAERVKENEPKIIESLKKEGFSDKEIKKFSKPEYWINVFSKKWLKDLKSMGLSIDWRRNFITTSLNPYYDLFIKWQFKKLEEKGYIIKGKHAVVWDSKTNMPVGDHDRIKGEGEVPQEFVLLKFNFDNKFIVAATLRPETIFGQTNLWVNPEVTYVEAKINDETWIISEPCASKLKDQSKEVKIINKLKGINLLGKYAMAPGINRRLIILPSSFCSEDKGTGIVTSVPSDSPDDYIALKDLLENKNEVVKYGLNYDEISKIKIIPIINSKDLGNKAAVKIVEDMKIKNQKERNKLEEAKKIVYKKSYYEGIMNNNCGKYSGLKVEIARDKIKKELLKNGYAELFYELSEEVISRSLTKCIVKIVSDQWFVKYSDEKWKKKAYEGLKRIKLYPEIVRNQFNYVIDWLNDWACTREYGLGTRLPFDKKWLIESLSDSTIYMAYYTIAHLINHISIDEIDDNFFDFIFLGKGEGKKEWLDLREEFEYWYPLDFRNSGKDLVQNHLTFFIFNHVAIFPKEYWPKSIGVNGWVKVGGEKMSKSLGNIIPLREMKEKYGADSSRLTILNGGEGLDDPNWDSRFAENLDKKFESLIFITENYGKGDNELRSTDKWIKNKLALHLEEAKKAMEETLFRSAIQKIFFDLVADIRWYLKRSKTQNKEVLKEVIESLIITTQPFTPHLAEELWHKIGKKDFVSLEAWPSYKIEKFDDTEKLIKNLIQDINNLLKLIKIKPKKLFIYSIPKELEIYKDAKDFLESEFNFKFNIFAVNDKNKYDPQNKAVKAKPGKPAIYLE